MDKPGKRIKRLQTNWTSSEMGNNLPCCASNERNKKTRRFISAKDAIRDTRDNLSETEESREDKINKLKNATRADLQDIFRMEEDLTGGAVYKTA